MNTPDFDMLVLVAIAKRDLGCSEQSLCAKFGKEAALAAKQLIASEFAAIHQHDLEPFMRKDSDAYKHYVSIPEGNIVATPSGKLEAKRWNVKHALSRKERWKERVFGFFFGVATIVLGNFMLKMLV